MTATRKSAMAYLTAGYSKSDPNAHLGERLARSWRHDPESESLLALPQAKRDALPPSTRVGLALYAGAREAARVHGIDTSPPVAP